MERTKVAFIFVTDDADPEKNHVVTCTDSCEFHMVGVPNYTAGAEVAASMAEYGCILIELCAGFNEEGTNMVVDAVRGKARVATCKMDYVPF